MRRLVHCQGQGWLCLWSWCPPQLLSPRPSVVEVAAFSRRLPLCYLPPSASVDPRFFCPLSVCAFSSPLYRSPLLLSSWLFHPAPSLLPSLSLHSFNPSISLLQCPDMPAFVVLWSSFSSVSMATLCSCFSGIALRPAFM